ncbi:MAG: TetR/AcrR family transcriptional regulator [Chloroflexota bacterium]
MTLFQADTKRNAVLKATLNLISEHGFHGTSMAMIAAEAEVGAGTIYRYFASKDILINELFLEIKEQFTAALLAHDDDTMSLKQRVEYIWIALIKQYIAYPAELRFMEQYANSPFLSTDTLRRQNELSVPFTTLLEQGLTTGLFRDLPIEVLRVFMYGPALQLAKQHIAGVTVLHDALLAAAFDACWAAVTR